MINKQKIIDFIKRDLLLWAMLYFSAIAIVAVFFMVLWIMPE